MYLTCRSAVHSVHHTGSGAMNGGCGTVKPHGGGRVVRIAYSLELPKACLYSTVSVFAMLALSIKALPGDWEHVLQTCKCFA